MPGMVYSLLAFTLDKSEQIQDSKTAEQWLGFCVTYLYQNIRLQAENLGGLPEGRARAVLSP